MTTETTQEAELVKLRVLRVGAQSAAPVDAGHAAERKEAA